MASNHSNITFKKMWCFIFLVCIAYAFVGRLALLLAIPPGYATAIFPSAGIAVAALLIWGNRIWPGVFLGSLLLNIWISVEQGDISTSVIIVAISAATGATLQSLAGAWLVRRFIGYQISLIRFNEILLFMILTGPLSCLINASFGATSLFAVEIIDANAFAYSWFTWWVGDTIGAFVAAPLMYVYFSEPKQLWSSRRKSVALPIVLMLTVVIGLYIWVSKLENERIQFEFNDMASDFSSRLSASLSSYLESLIFIERFFVTTNDVTREKFREFLKFVLANKPGIQGISWNPLVSQQERAIYETSIRQEGFPNFSITERNEKNELIKAADREFYVTAKYIEPILGNEKALGFDVNSNSIRREALVKARDSGEAVATAAITLVQEKNKQAGFLLFYPVYHGSHNTLEERIENLTGYVVGVFRINDIVNSVLQVSNKGQFIIKISDKSETDNKVIYGDFVSMPSASSLYDWRGTIEVGKRQWEIQFAPSSEFMAQHRGWQAWVMLATGLLFTSLLGAFFLTLSGRSFEIEGLVKQRTAELSGILTSASETIITISHDGKIESVNPAGQALLGYSFTELFGRQIKEIIPEFFAAENAESASESSYISNKRRDTYVLRKNDTKVPVELAISKLELPQSVLYTLIIHDLTERMKLNRMKDEFIATVSHELRTPLTSIKGSLGLLNGNVLGEFSEKVKELLKISYKNIERLELLINDLLDINKLEYENFSLRLERILIGTLIKNSLASTQGYADKFNVKLQWLPDPADEVYINADENKLIQVLSNLLSNAIKFSPTNEVVTISTRKIGNLVRVEVSDNGPGIPLDFQDKIFKKFSQADSSDKRRVGSTGLGLAISRAIIEKHLGNIGFVSTPGQGAKFYFDLPIS